MKLETQISRLAELGLPLATGRTVDDLLHSLPRDVFERRPYEVLLSVLGAEVEEEPWGRWFCDRAWNLDAECVHGPGAYAGIARQLCRIAGRPDAFTDVRDHVDLEAEEAWIEYAVDGRVRRWSAEVHDDWADMMVVSYLMDDLERDGRRFWTREGGQIVNLYFLDEAAARGVNGLFADRDPLVPVLGGGG
ncbi:MULTISPECIES: hypothetical protein [Streptomyces]|uniref:SMI1/KNR4 family protein n=1 Tax=Streptomyces sudanensis TaxID=436397 RepID=A0ABY4TP15_9ACTN|nr:MULTISPECIES: hypothetical protein [Streptomyces]MCP9960173.1 hypothetical protein [Streptomyces sudanensis]MCP9999457.1 hypothetical protein [Streptomyces sudanensis]URN18497.1 hypothetical protein MW084_23945 [Streptomyces sudanensis]